MHLWMTKSVPEWPKCQGWGRSCFCPCTRPSSPRLLWCQPAPSPASVRCGLHQLPSERPNFNPSFRFLYCSWCFREADCSRPVTMADCCCFLSPCWSHKILQQSTGLLKPLIKCMVSGDNQVCLAARHGCSDVVCKAELGQEANNTEWQLKTPWTANK